jgi:hypothetical protein
MTRDNKSPNWKLYMIIGGVCIVIPLVLFGIGIIFGGDLGEGAWGFLPVALIGWPIFIIGLFLVGWGWLLKVTKSK